MSVKKSASGRRAVQAEAEVPGSTQSAVARRSAEAQLRTLIARFSPAHLRLIGTMRHRPGNVGGVARPIEIARRLRGAQILKIDERSFSRVRGDSRW